MIFNDMFSRFHEVRTIFRYQHTFTDGFSLVFRFPSAESRLQTTWGQNAWTRVSIQWTLHVGMEVVE